MTDGVSFKVDGLRELEASLLKLEAKVATKQLRKALSAAAVPIVRDAKSRAPVDTGALRQSIGKRTLKGKYKNVAITIIGPIIKNKRALALSNAARANTIKGIFYGHMVEFGNTYKGLEQRPQPFLRPALDSQAKKATQIFSRILKKGIDSVARK